MFNYAISVLDDRLSELQSYRHTIIYRDGGDKSTKMMDFIAIEEKIQDISASLELLRQFSEFSDSEAPDDEKLVLSDSEIRDICRHVGRFEMEEEAFE